MKVRIQLFAVAKELAGCGEVTVDAPPSVTIAELRQIVAQQFPSLRNVVAQAMWAVNAEYASDETPLEGNQSVALIPPVSGG